MVSSKNQSKYRRDSDENNGMNRDSNDFQIDTTEYTTRLELLYEVANKATSYPEILKLIEDILSVTQRILRSSAVSLMVVDDGKGILSYQLADDQFHSSLKPVRLSVNSGMVRWVARTGMTIIIDDVNEDERYDADVDDIEGVETRSILAVPLSRGQKVIGVLMVVNKSDDGTFTEQDSVVLSGFLLYVISTSTGKEQVPAGALTGTRKGSVATRGGLRNTPCWPLRLSPSHPMNYRQSN